MIKAFRTSEIASISSSQAMQPFRLNPKQLARLDPDGWHLCSEDGFMHDGGVYGVDTWRGTVYFKLRDREEPLTAFIDIPLVLYNSFIDAETLREAQD